MSLKNSFLDAVAIEDDGQETVDENKVVETTTEQEEKEEPQEKEPPSDEPEKERNETKEVDLNWSQANQTDEKEKEVEIEEVVQELDYKSFLEEHKDTIKEYLKDYKSMDKVEVLKLKLEKDGFDRDEVQDYLEHKYGVGVDKIKIDKDEMTEEEVKEAQAFNRALSEAKRDFKKDSEEAVSYFEGLKGALELPKWEVKQEIKKDKNEVASFSQEDYERQITEQIKESKEKVWTPMLDSALTQLSSVKHQTKYIDNDNEVVLDINYSLTEAEKSEIRTQLIDYVSQPSDSIYVGQDGSVDIQRFVADRAKEKYVDKLIQTAAKEAAANARRELVKNELLNFDDSGRQKGGNEDNDKLDIAGLFAAAKKVRNDL